MALPSPPPSPPRRRELITTSGCCEAAWSFKVATKAAQAVQHGGRHHRVAQVTRWCMHGIVDDVRVARSGSAHLRLCCIQTPKSVAAVIFLLF